MNNVERALKVRSREAENGINGNRSVNGQPHVVEPGQFLTPTLIKQLETASTEKPKYFGYKYALERLIALVLLLPALPLIAICGVAVLLTSRGPVIFRQQRVGMQGRVFFMLKIRTMIVDAEEGMGPSWSTIGDPRITRVGRFLRFLHLDELPQLFNVVLGEMTIIGPRPERPEIVAVLSEQVEGYTDRLVAKPGITGLAQIYLPPDMTIDCVRRKVCFDRSYIESASPFVDLRIWLCTLVRILGIRGGRGPKWFGLDRSFRKAIEQCSFIGKMSENGYVSNARNGSVRYDNEKRHDAESRPVPVFGGDLSMKNGTSNVTSRKPK